MNPNDQPLIADVVEKEVNPRFKESQVLPRDVRDAELEVEVALMDLFQKAGMDMTTSDTKAFHRQMQDLKIRVIKVGFQEDFIDFKGDHEHSGYQVYKGDIFIGFVPAKRKDGVMI